MIRNPLFLDASCLLSNHFLSHMPLLKPVVPLPKFSPPVALNSCFTGPLVSQRGYRSSRAVPGALSLIPTARTNRQQIESRVSTKLQVQPQQQKRLFSLTKKYKMASDEDYMSFLDKANKDPSEGYAKTETKKDDQGGFKATEQGVEIPRAIAKVVGKDLFYVSDADEPFEAVALKLGEDGLPDEEEFARLIKHPMPKDAEVEILDPIDWDRNGQYSQIVDAVREAGEGNDVRVYRIARGGVKAEYWIVTATSDKKLVGVKALAVES
ncbi:hypothetical protein V8F20_000229 [Naviculisporaceae sp. PSN 640]